MAYHEINGTRRYEYRYADGDGLTGWMSAGLANPETLAKIKAGLPDINYEVRAVCGVADDTGTHVGCLIFSQLIHKQESEEA